ncbi:LolA family protein [Billgrantia endophytica]|uniref:DUF1571 domain-containing protein n=1 Tax=Billgrantia endophytica TaxID=2033802 RepID=A0A2N7U816_9GAMM|nr:sigma-E factor regulatory protein RseB domain-containing protein [Halomonas endophytica]PMR76553.1 DUF1571 domain-containing protein [Halomonas endophytica]
MLSKLLVLMAAGPASDPVSAALEHVENLHSYQLTLHGQGGRGEEVIRYTYQKPGYIRMDLVTPHKGVVLIYRPDTRKVQLWPFGSPGRRSGLTLSPNNRMVRSAQGHRADQSDVGTLLRNIQALQRHGKTHLLGEAELATHPAQHLMVEGDPGEILADIVRYELWLDSERQFPLKVVSYNRRGEQLEAVRLEEISINPELPENLFFP